MCSTGRRKVRRIRWIRRLYDSENVDPEPDRRSHVHRRTSVYLSVEKEGTGPSSGRRQRSADDFGQSEFMDLRNRPGQLRFEIHQRKDVADRSGRTAWSALL